MGPPFPFAQFHLFLLCHPPDPCRLFLPWFHRDQLDQLLPPGLALPAVRSVPALRCSQQVRWLPSPLARLAAPAPPPFLEDPLDQFLPTVPQFPVAQVVPARLLFPCPLEVLRALGYQENLLGQFLLAPPSSPVVRGNRFFLEDHQHPPCPLTPSLLLDRQALSLPVSLWVLWCRLAHSLQEGLVFLVVL